MRDDSTHLRVPRETWTAVRDQAARTGAKMCDVAAAAVAAYVEGQEMSNDERAKIIAASGSGGSAPSALPPLEHTLRFGAATFGGDDATLIDDHGNALFPKTCALSCVGSHIWTHESGVLCYCAGPDAARERA
jgi:hypothetical protein